MTEPTHDGDHITQGSDTLNKSAEHEDLVSQLREMRAKNDPNKSLRAQALKELADSGVHTISDPRVIEAKELEIAQRNQAPNN